MRHCRKETAGLDVRDYLIALVVGLSSLALYWRTLAPGLLPGDSGEFQTLAHLLGDTHPTGYPVYLLLARPFTWLPLGDIAYRVNLFSAVMAGLTVAGVYLVGKLLTGHRAAALLGALALAVSPTFWSQSLIAEVYTPGAAFLIAVLLTLLLWDATGDARYLFASGVLGGLSLGVHLTVALLAPAVGLLLLIGRHRGKAAWRSAFLGALAGAGLTLLAFLAVDGHAITANYFNSVVQPSRSAWDLSVADLDGSFDRLLFGLSALQFRPYMFSDPAEVMPQQASEYWDNLPSEFSTLTIILAGLGMLGLLVRRRRLAALLLLALVTQWLYTFNYAIWDLYVFHIPSYVLLALLVGAGAGWLLDGWITLARNLRGRRLAEPLLAAAALAFCLGPVLMLRLDAVIEGQPSFDYDEYPVNEFSLNLLHPLATATVSDLPKNSILFTDWDMLYPFYYVAHIEQGRTDLTFVETLPRDDAAGLADSVSDYVRAQLAAGSPVLFSERLPQIQAAGYRLGPFRAGPTLLYRVLPTNVEGGG